MSEIPASIRLPIEVTVTADLTVEDIVHQTNVRVEGCDLADRIQQKSIGSAHTEKANDLIVARAQARFYQM
jgi:hypothetical protein